MTISSALSWKDQLSSNEALDLSNVYSPRLRLPLDLQFPSSTPLKNFLSLDVSSPCKQLVLVLGFDELEKPGKMFKSL
jgi:hypothetical protein